MSRLIVGNNNVVKAKDIAFVSAGPQPTVEELKHPIQRAYEAAVMSQDPEERVLSEVREEGLELPPTAIARQFWVICHLRQGVSVVVAVNLDECLAGELSDLIAEFLLKRSKGKRKKPLPCLMLEWAQERLSAPCRKCGRGR
jgi:hypothetical protein